MMLLQPMTPPQTQVSGEALNATNLEGGGVVLLPNGLPEQGLEKTYYKVMETLFQDSPAILFFKEGILRLTINPKILFYCT